MRDQIVKSVQTSVSDALIVALCIAIGEKSVRKDSKRLRDLAGKAQSDTARSHIVCALKQVFDQHKPDHTECTKVLKLLTTFPDSPKICELREALKKLRISQYTEEQIPEKQILNIEGC